MLFAKTPCRFEVINDVNGELINFFRVVKHRAAELAEAFEMEIVGRDRFHELKDAPDDSGEIQRAVRFLYLQDQSFGSKGQNFAAYVPKYGRPAVKKTLAAVRLSAQKAAERLATVLIENHDWQWCVDRFDSPETFFYCDPPYTAFGKIGAYEAKSAEFFETLFDRLSQIQGRFLLSLDNSELALTLTKRHGLKSRPVQTTYTLSAMSSKPVTELLISNYKLPE